MDLQHLQACLLAAPESVPSEGDQGAGFEGLTPAAVLVPLVPRPEGYQLLLTRRTDHLRDHPGQISFPGGRVEPEDASPAHTALREAQEEIGLDPGLPRILGYLPTYRTGTGFHVFPVVALLPGATLTSSWDGVPLPEERLMPAADVAEMAWTAWNMSARTVVEDIVMRPQRGDIGDADFEHAGRGSEPA